MKLLAIETATRQLGVALLNEEHILSSYELLADYPHAVELPGAVQRVLKAARLTLHDIEAIAVDIGPGSFTGLRIGLAFVKALAFPQQQPLIGVPSLDVLAAQLPYAPRPVCPILDARQGNVYAALYHHQADQPATHTDYLLAPIDEVLTLITEPTIFLGDGCVAYRDHILARCPEAQFAPAEWWLPNASTLARLGLERAREGRRDDPATLIPMYLYPLDCSVRSPERPTSVLPRGGVRVSA